MTVTDDRARDRNVEYISTDPDIPPVAIIDRSPMTPTKKVIFAAIGVLGAIAWAIVAFVRGENVNAVWFVIAALCTYIVAYRFNARLIEMKIVQPRDDHATPAEIEDNAQDYMPTDRRVLFGHHFAAIAGAGPLVGPVLAAQMGYLPGTIWIIVGAVAAGCVQDYLVLSISTRRRGRSLGQMARDELGPIGGSAALLAVFVIMIILLAVLALVVVNALAESPWGVFSIAMTIPIAIFMGIYLRFLRPGRVSEISLIGVVLLLLAIISGRYVGESSWGHDVFSLSPVALSWAIIIYGVATAVLPVWLLLAPRDYLSTFMKVGTICLLALGILLVQPVMKAPAVSEFAHTGQGPAFAGSLFPFLFITIACGALSGFHSLIASGTTPKLLAKEGQAKIIGYGRHADRVLCRDHGAGHRVHPGSAPLLRDERAQGAHRGHPAGRRRLRQQPQPAGRSGDRGVFRSARRGRRRAVDRLQDRRRAHPRDGYGRHPAGCLRR